MLHEVAASDLDVTHIVSPLRALLTRTTLIVGDIEGVDLAAGHIRVRHGFDGHEHDVAYDHLVLALGSISHDFGLPGVADHALTMKTLDDAIRLSNRVIAALEEAGSECQNAEVGLLTFVVAGGGFAGVETLAAMNDFVHGSLRHYPRIAASAVRMVLVHSGPHVLPELGEHLGRYTEAKLRARGIEVLTHTRVAGASAESVVLGDGRLIPSRTLV